MPDPIYVYATEADLKEFGLSGADKKRTLEPGQIDRALAAASDVANGYLDDGSGFPFTLPLLEPSPPALAMRTAWIAAYLIMSSLGYSPEPGTPDIYRDRYDDAIKWLSHLAEGKTTLSGVVDSGTSGATADIGVPFVVSGTSRGYSSRGLSSARGGPEIITDMTMPGRDRDGGGGFVGD